MGSRGRQPTPTSLRLVKGNPGKRPLPEGEPAPEAGIPSPPPYLTKEAGKYWAYFVKKTSDMGVLTVIDGTALAQLCECYAKMIHLRGVLSVHGGYTYESYTAEGNVIWRPRPEVPLLMETERLFRQYLIDFGMTPASRTKVKVADDSKKTQDHRQQYFNHT